VEIIFLPNFIVYGREKCFEHDRILVRIEGSSYGHTRRQGRSQRVCKGCPSTPLGEKMAGGDYRAEK
jgi:hypothetical protein